MDPIFQCQLAEILHMTVAELMHGRGAPMSAHELAVVWPTYHRTVARMEQRARTRREMTS